MDWTYYIPYIHNAPVLNDGSNYFRKHITMSVRDKLCQQQSAR